MAGASTDHQQFGVDAYLSRNQQDLLVAALSSQSANSQLQKDVGKAEKRNSTGQTFHREPYNQQQNFVADYNSSNLLPQQNNTEEKSTTAYSLEDTSYVDWLGASDGLDYSAVDDVQAWNEDLDENQPAIDGDNDASADDDHELESDLHDKRKMSGDINEEDETENKRREGEEKVAKKPGRKPLISEASTKRKAQNRAAQRAFRERKEKHLLDLETKITELEKSSQSVNQENGLLRAKVQRLQTELAEYRKRLSLNGPRVGSMGARANSYSTGIDSGTTKVANFQFDFPRFGFPLSNPSPNNENLFGKPEPSPSNNTHDQGNIPGVLSRKSANSRSTSTNENFASSGVTFEPALQDPLIPRSGANSSLSMPIEQSSSNGSGSPWTVNTSLDSNLTSPQIDTKNDALNSHGHRSSVSSVATNQNRVFKFNSGGMPSMTNSPSESAWSNIGPTSSCGTSPEPGQSSPYMNRQMNGQASKAIGHPPESQKQNESAPAVLGTSHSVQQTESPSNIDLGTFNSANVAVNADAFPSSKDIKSFDWLANENGGQFDPLLFGTYREPQDAIIGNGEFTGGFFDDALPFGFGNNLGLDANGLPAFSELPDLTPTASLSRMESVRNGDDFDQGYSVNVALSGNDNININTNTNTNTNTDMSANLSMPSATNGLGTEMTMGAKDLTNAINKVSLPDEAKIAKCKEMLAEIKARSCPKNDDIDIDNLCSEMRTKARCSETGVLFDKKDLEAYISKATMST